MVLWRVRPQLNRPVFSRYLGMYAIRRTRHMFIDLPS
ncbi:hypothetical protein T4D_2529 [Trichinella pseudospiralis]|uniref:Uncharacterized protein n=1 Tax=Trichinella pseudospiralis TaxID=6337 RepID=A0A0V1DT02_TRIPS|nr:hypothetical protein T4D_2529 [Trichinella pseudospiralis]